MEAAPSSERKKIRFTRKEWQLLLILAAIQFTSLLDFVIMMPLAPMLRSQLSLNPNQFGYVVASYGITAFIGSIIASSWLDRMSRKTALLVLYGGFLLATAWCGLAESFEMLLTARSVAGLFGGVVGSAIMAIIGDHFQDSRRGTAIGLVMSSFALASIAGVPLGLLIAENAGYRAPFLVIAGGAALIWIFAAFVMPPMREHLQHPDAKSRIIDLVRVPRYYWAYLFSLTLTFGSFMVIPFIADYATKNIGTKETHLKYVYLVAGCVTLITTNLIGRLSDHFGKLVVFRVVCFGSVIFSLIFTHLGQSSLGMVFLVTSGFMVFTSGRMVPGSALTTNMVKPQIRAGFMSLVTALQYAGMGIASILGGLIIRDSSGGKLLGYGTMGLLAAASMMISILIAGQLRQYPTTER
ncbi:MAG: MFS transporter [Zavarzinella sp.]